MAPDKQTNSQKEIIRQTEAVVDHALAGKFATKEQFQSMINELAAKAKLESPALGKKIELVRDDILSKYESLVGKEFAEKRQIRLRTKEKILRILDPEHAKQSVLSPEIRREILNDRYYNLQKTINSLKWAFMYRAKFPSPAAETFVSKCTKKFQVIEQFMSEGTLFNDRINQEMDELENLLDGRDPKSHQKTAAGFEFVKYVQLTTEELRLAELERDKVLNPLAQKVIDSVDSKNLSEFQNSLQTLISKFATYKILNDVNFDSRDWNQYPAHKGMMLMISQGGQKIEVSLINMSNIQIVSFQPDQNPLPFEKLYLTMHPAPAPKTPEKLATK